MWTRRQVPGGSCARSRRCSSTIATLSLSAPEPWHTEFMAARSSAARAPAAAKRQRSFDMKS